MSHGFYTINKEKKIDHFLDLKSYWTSSLDFIYKSLDAEEFRSDLSGTGGSKTYSLSELKAIRHKIFNRDASGLNDFLPYYRFDVENTIDYMEELDCDENGVVEHLLQFHFGDVIEFIDKAIELAEREGSAKIDFW